MLERKSLRGAGSIMESFDPQRNALNVLRLLFATVVAVAHALAIGFGYQPHIGFTAAGDLAVDGFFVLSGFLVTRSYLTLGHLPRFLWHRFLRIMPGFWVCLLLMAFVVAPIAAALEGGFPWRVLDGPESSWAYLASNVDLLMNQFGINGAFDGASINGSLWTLFYEGFCYGLVALFGVLGLLRRRRWTVLLLAIALTLLGTAIAAGLAPTPSLEVGYIIRLTLMFLVGAILFLYAERISLSFGLAVGAGVVLALSLWLLPDFRVPLGSWAFAYAVVYAAVRLPWHFDPRMDLSYGIYIYHWPIQQLLATLGLTVVGQPLFVTATVAATAGAATLSWLLVEEPALRRKSARWVGRVGRHRAVHHHRDAGDAPTTDRTTALTVVKRYR